jgi:uncharacterized membrane protein
MATDANQSSAESTTRDSGGAESLTSQLGLNRFGEQLQGLVSAWAEHGVSALSERLSGSGSSVTGKTVKNLKEGDSAPKAALKAGVESVKDTGTKAVSSAVDKVGDVFSGDSKDKKDKKFKFINIVEELDLPVPRPVAYRAWTEFEEFPSFMKKVENVEQQEDATIEWKAQIFWSHRSWTAEIVDQVPNERIVWRSKGEKGHVDGAVTFHELTPDLTRMLVNLEYYPQGLFERTGNLWRAQGRRVRLELKFFRRYLTSEVLLRQDEVEGWSGEIHDGEVTEQSAGSEDSGSDDQGSDDQGSEQKGSEQEGSAQKPSRGSASDGTSGANAKRSNTTASKAPAKKSAVGAASSSQSRPAAEKSTPSKSSSSRPGTTAKRSQSGSAASSRGSSARKTTSSSSRSRS